MCHQAVRNARPCEQQTSWRDCPRAPREGAVGCCATTSGSVDFDQCYYGISTATGEMTCATAMGTWTPTSVTSEAGATD
jgi:hypothetical protein